LTNVVITGATKGIGRAIVEIFATQGANLYLCARSKEDLKALKADLLARFPTIKVYIKKTDVSKKKQVIAFAAFIAKNTNSINVLVNNAGVFLPGPMVDEADGILETHINTNLYSAYYLTKALLPLLRASPSSHIFNMCSIVSKMTLPNCGAYSISKFALLGFSKALRAELKTENIKVTALLPGATWSNSWEGVDLPASRLMEAADIAKVVLNAYQLGDSAVVEEIIIRPQLGDL